ncbi:hypothetical protein KIPB_005171 [Kipferlia bialata]|uniref:non-specific serine/threonine protein kinase n=1 Tax=Kipferlia bialata TaxID=797122 RepID=A0A9K3CUZ0_9EUKA|nr:hypothetical protein KIPB_005171 [Kipferlia bialata]|eukprot:g5171.t1
MSEDYEGVDGASPVNEEREGRGCEREDGMEGGREVAGEERPGSANSDDWIDVTILGTQTEAQEQIDLDSLGVDAARWGEIKEKVLAAVESLECYMGQYYLEMNRYLYARRARRHDVLSGFEGEEQQDALDALKARETLLLRSKRAGVSQDDFEQIKLLSRGGFSEVYLVRSKTNGQLYAMKVINKELVTGPNPQRRMRAERAALLGK